MRDRPLIAVVDDDPSVCKALSRLMRSARMDTETFSSAVEFLVVGMNHEPDCLVLDVQMPGMSGLELCDRLAGRKNRIPVIFITAHDDPGVRESTAVKEAVAFLRKPFGDEDLLGAIAEAMKDPNARDSGPEAGVISNR
jgi:FixJ family two-component response regulator